MDAEYERIDNGIKALCKLVREHQRLRIICRCHNDECRIGKVRDCSACERELRIYGYIGVQDALNYLPPLTQRGAHK